VLEHKETLGHYEHSVFYVQEFVDKPGRDIRVLACDGDPVAAMARSGDHWVTNAANGAETEAFEVDSEVSDLVAQASEAVGGGLLGVDLMEVGVDDTGTAGGYTVHEINHTVEFKALNDTVDGDVPGQVVDWLESTVENWTAEAQCDELAPETAQTGGD
jgi:[lysine-biosynthesis-protein LysW]--L-2-aminoadipate ligase